MSIPVDLEESHDVSEHSTCEQMIRFAYVLGTIDFENGRLSPRTGEEIVRRICEALGMEEVKLMRKHPRYFKAIYQLAKYNCAMQETRQ